MIMFLNVLLFAQVFTIWSNEPVWCLVFECITVIVKYMDVILFANSNTNRELVLSEIMIVFFICTSCIFEKQVAVHHLTLASSILDSNTTSCLSFC